MAVAYPTDKHVVHEETGKGLEVYSIWTAISNGKMPSNKQLRGLGSSLTDGAKSVAKERQKKISDPARKFFSDFSKLIDNSFNVFAKKNEGDLLQNAIYELSQAEGSTNVNEVWNDITEDMQSQDFSTEDLKQLFLLIFNNGKLRTLLQNAIALLGQQTTNVASKKLNEQDGKKSDNLRNGVNKVKQNMRNGASARDQAREQGSKAKDKIKNDPDAQKAKEETKQKLQDLYEEFKSVAVDLQGDPKYQHPVRSLLNLIDKFIDKLSEQSGNVTADTNEHYDRAMQYLKQLVENILNRSLDNLIDTLKQVQHDAENDEELKDWLESTRQFVRKVLLKKGYAKSDASDKEFNKLRDKGDELLNGRYKKRWQQLSSEVKKISDSASSDKDVKQLFSNYKNIYGDLIKREGGQISLKTSMCLEILRLGVPVILEKMQYFPIPRLEIEQPDFDVVLENLNLQTANVLPKLAEFRNNNFVRFSPYANITSFRENMINVHLSNIQCDLKDVNYYIKRKQGFPTFTDLGVVDLLIGKQGMVVNLTLSSFSNTMFENELPDSFFKVEDVKVDIHHIKLKIRKSRHRLLLAFLKPSLMTYVRSTVARSMELSIRHAFEQVDREWYEIHKEAKSEIEKDSSKPTEDQESKLKVYGRVAYSRISNLHKSSKEKGKDSQVRVALHKENTALNNIVLPSGNLQRSEEKRRAALSGSTWHSPAFNIFGVDDSEDSDSPWATDRGSRLYQRTKGSVKSRESRLKKEKHKNRPASKGTYTTYTSSEERQRSTEDPLSHDTLSRTILNDQIVKGNVTEIPLPPLAVNEKRASVAVSSIPSFGDDQHDIELLNSTDPRKNRILYNQPPAVA